MVEHANLGRLLRRGGWLGKTAAGAAVVMLSAGVAGSQGPEAVNVAPAPNPDAVVHVGDALPAGDRASITQPALATPATGKELKFVPLTPCRLFDTRQAGGALVAAEIRPFETTGGLSGQGGSAAGCRVPSFARAVEMNLGAIAAGGAGGYLKAYAFTDPEPLASTVNYPASGAIANMVSVEMTGSAAHDVNIRASSNVHVFADVAGYWVQPMYALIDDSGAVHDGTSSGLVASVRLSTGVYELTFNRSVRHCTVTASDAVFQDLREVSPDATSFPNIVRVEVKSLSGSPANTFFYVSLDC